MIWGRLGTRPLLLFQSPIEYKQPILSGLIAQFPQRRFVLIGDSGEKDPEVYAAVYRVHPQQVAGIYIRDVTGEARDAPRYQTAFTGIPADRWTIFTDPATLPAAGPSSPACARTPGRTPRCARPWRW